MAMKIGVTSETIKNLERGVHRPSDDTKKAMDLIFEMEGIAFFELPGDAMGVILDRSRSRDALAIQNKALSPPVDYPRKLKFRHKEKEGVTPDELLTIQNTSIQSPENNA